MIECQVSGLLYLQTSHISDVQVRVHVHVGVGIHALSFYTHANIYSCLHYFFLSTAGRIEKFGKLATATRSRQGVPNKANSGTFLKKDLSHDVAGGPC
jgi:hypothetical protein